MKRLIFDTETTGLPSTWSASPNDVSVWPRIVELAWIVFNEENQATSSPSFIVKPEGFTIPIEASKVHGISNEKAIAEGVSLRTVMNTFAEDLSEVNEIIAHNIDFDYPVVNCEFERLEIQTNIHDLTRTCTMKSTREYCNIQGNIGLKWPSMQELYQHLFNRGFKNAHRASKDVFACAECYVELKQRNII